ncbi:cytochrome b561, partial [Homo sapiens]
MWQRELGSREGAHHWEGLKTSSWALQGRACAGVCLSMEGGAAAATPTALPYYVAFSQLLGLTLVAMTGAWLGLYRGGIAWESDLQFNAHPLCMV